MGGFLKKLKGEVPYDQAILLLSIYPKKRKTVTQEDICTPVLIAALFAIAKICNQMDKWIKKMWCIYIHTQKIIVLNHKKNETLLFAETWLDLEGIMLSEISQTESSWFHLHVEPKNKANEQT